MSKDEREFDSFAEISKEEEDRSILETLLRAPSGSNVQNQLARGNVGDASNEPTSDLFHYMSGPRNPICSDMGAEGGQNVVCFSENVKQSTEYSLSQPTSNKRNLSDTQDSLPSCSIHNKKMRFYEINLCESICQPLHLSITEASYKTDGISSGGSSSCQKTKRNTSTSSKECSSSALSSSKKSRDQGKKYVCDVCRKEFSYLSRLKTHMRIHTGEKPHICEICQKTFSRSSTLKSHEVIQSGTKPHHCEYCDFETAHKNFLNRHSKKYHSEHMEKCLVCCDYFYSKESLQSHKCTKL
ncbi:hypothetical protein CDAR_212331 [Caerostris darwini]|uniref:C2H2-type domain-containing protein n=1 Tax=Caerostris darwini TaxID=1538125 RepID=A0AAV4TL84_9ARAC|nr:hypothetical protein CDAR_212331 [Caerostris darwini]